MGRLLEKTTASGPVAGRILCASSATGGAWFGAAILLGVRCLDRSERIDLSDHLDHDPPERIGSQRKTIRIGHLLDPEIDQHSPRRSLLTDPVRLDKDWG
jgi:hypothetical protein